MTGNAPLITRFPGLTRLHQAWLRIDTRRWPQNADRRTDEQLIAAMCRGHALVGELEDHPYDDVQQQLIDHVRDFVLTAANVLEFRGQRHGNRTAQLAAARFWILDGYAEYAMVEDLTLVLSYAGHQILEQGLTVPRGAKGVPVPEMWQLVDYCLTELRFRVQRKDKDAVEAAAAIAAHDQLLGNVGWPPVRTGGWVKVTDVDPDDDAATLVNHRQAG